MQYTMLGNFISMTTLSEIVYLSMQSAYIYFCCSPPRERRDAGLRSAQTRIWG